jgi:type IV pilus assembly protein PilW
MSPIISFASPSGYAERRIIAPRESGFTLIELLIAVLLALIVVLVVGGVFLANVNTFRFTDDYSRLQENGRFALQTLTRVVRQAGYVPVDVSQQTGVDVSRQFPAGLAGIGAARFVAGVNGSGPKNSDSLTVAYRGSVDGQIQDCAGGRIGVPAVLGAGGSAATLPLVTNTFSVAASPSGVGTSLYCTVAVSTGGAAPVASPAVELISGVESFQVLYALDEAANDFGLPDRYTSANLMTGDQFNRVVGVQVALVLRGAELNTQDANPVSNSIYPFGKEVFDGLGSSDAGTQYVIATGDRKRAFRSMNLMINLRNKAV